MADYTTLLQLILIALMFVIIGMGLIAYHMMTTGERERKRLRAERISATTKVTPDNCLHYFGYLRQYPTDQPIPEECFGCIKAIQCINQKPRKETPDTPNEVIEQVQQPT